jgi:hypothetical protein
MSDLEGRRLGPMPARANPLGAGPHTGLDLGNPQVSELMEPLTCTANWPLRTSVRHDAQS